MPDFIYQLLREPLVWLILVSWAFSMIGGQMQKAARKAKQQRERGDSPAGRAAGGSRPSRGPDPDEIAREIRRAMGLERSEPAQRPARSEPAQKPAPPAPPPVRRSRPMPEAGVAPSARRAPPRVEELPELPIVLNDDGTRRGRLREEMAARDAARERELAESAARDAHLGEHVRDRHPDAHADRAGHKPSVRRRRGVLDLTRPASAIVAMEVLGPPISLRRSAMPRDV